MLRKLGMLVTLSSLYAGSVWAQGLTTQASKDDWEEINFEFNTAVLSDGYPSLLCLADKLHKNPTYHVKVEGNTDNIGSARFNERLGLARANTVKDFLVKYGAAASQIEVATRGKTNPEVQGFKRGYSKTDVARWMNRRVVLTVTDQTGKTIAAGCNEVQITEKENPQLTKCCEDILKRLDELATLLKGMRDENGDLRRRLDALEKHEDTEHNKIEGQISALPKPLTRPETEQVVDSRLARFRDPRFSLLGFNIGADDHRDLTFTGKGRFFAPFKDHFAIQMQGEYLYFRAQKEGQADIGLVNRLGNFQAGAFASFKTVSLRDAGTTGTLGQGAAVFDYIFSLGKIGVYGTKGFMNTAVLDRRNAVLDNGFTAPNTFIERYLRVVDQAGAQGTFGLWRQNYVEANVGYMRTFTGARPGGTVRFIFPFGSRFAFTLEGGVNETLISRDATGRAVIGFQIGNFLRPKEFLGVSHPVPMEVPRVRYEVLERRVRTGISTPIADAGPDQIGVAAGTITLNGSNSRDPNGEPLTYQWVQEAGPAVSLSGANGPVATFTAAAGQNYSFRLTVRNTDGQSSSARVRVSTNAPQNVQVLFFIANPTTIDVGGSSQLSWRVLNADTVTITPGIGTVNASNGTVTVTPTTNTTYTLTARNASGSTDTATASVVIRQTPPTIPTCTASPMNVIAGESATILFSTLNATSVSINNGVGNVGMNGTIVVTPTDTTNYVVTATNQFGTATCSVAIQVTAGAAPRIVRFSATPTTIQTGGTATLLWLVDNADTVTITPGLGTVSRADTRDVQPTQTTTYTLTATNRAGSVTATATVTVNTGPPVTIGTPTITSFTANPPTSPSAGSAVVLTCKTANALQVIISGIGPVDANGNRTVNPTTTTTYVCVAVNGPQQASANVTVPVGTGGGPTTLPVVVVSSSAATCSPGTAAGPTVCQTVVRTLDLNLSGSTSPSGNNPLTFFTTSRSSSAAVLNPTSSTPTVQLAELFGDYFFDVTVTDAKGNQTTVPVDVQLVVTRVR